MKDATHYVTQGKAEFNAARETVRITELPIRKWTQDYKQFLEGFMSEPEKKKKVSSGAPALQYKRLTCCAGSVGVSRRPPAACLLLTKPP